MILELLQSGFADLGLTVPAHAAEQLDRYAQLLLEKNQVMNLTAITEPTQVAQLHMLDCAALLKLVDFENASLVDVGTGAGFPGVPMKIYCHDLDVTLLDSLMKRVKFLEAVAAETLPMTCIHARAEDGGRDKSLRERYDVAAARAVAALPVLAEYLSSITETGFMYMAER